MGDTTAGCANRESSVVGRVIWRGARYMAQRRSRDVASIEEWHQLGEIIADVLDERISQVRDGVADARDEDSHIVMSVAGPGSGPGR